MNVKKRERERESCRYADKYKDIVNDESFDGSCSVILLSA
jgi:hypothetical protein